MRWEKMFTVALQRPTPLHQMLDWNKVLPISLCRYAQLWIHFHTDGVAGLACLYGADILLLPLFQLFPLPQLMCSTFSIFPWVRRF